MGIFREFFFSSFNIKKNSIFFGLKRIPIFWIKKDSYFFGLKIISFFFIYKDFYILSNRTQVMAVFRFLRF